MTRKRGAAIKSALIASLAVAFGVGSSALATTPPSEPAGGTGGECPRDIAAAAAAETTAPPATTTAAAPATTAAAAPATTAPAAPATTAAPGTTAPPATLPENVTQLDPEATSSINPQPRDALQQGGTVRLVVNSLAENWNPFHPDGNELDFREVLDAMNYWPVLVDAAGVRTPNPDFVLDITQTDDPFTVTYTLNPEAVWHSGEPITAEDYRANWEATNGINPEFQVVSTEGSELISSVEQGADEFEVVVTFCEPYPDYDGLFWQLSPAESVATPEMHNEGWIAGLDELNDWMTGPFEVGTYDAAAGFVELVPSDTWWGEPPLLDSIQFTVVSQDAWAQAYANNEIDSFDIGPDPNGYALAFNTPGSEIRAAAGPNWRHVTLNSGPNGGLIQDQVIRQAIQMSLDRAAIGVSDLAGIPWPAKPLGNHIFVENSEFYVDNTDPWGTYDPDAAMALLEENGWVAGADGVREKDGQRLTVRHTQIVGVPVSENEAQLIQSQLAEVGVEVEVVDITAQEFSETLTSGEYEMIAFSWIGTPYPFTSIQQLFGNGSDSNFGYSTIPGIDEMIDEISTTVDQVERARLANEVDVILWEYGHTIPLYQRPELIATRADLANYGAFGFIRPAGWAHVGSRGAAGS
jgi:peptide/nickel transport system substrate-binding protein